MMDELYFMIMYKQNSIQIIQILIKNIYFDLIGIKVWIHLFVVYLIIKKVNLCLI